MLDSGQVVDRYTVEALLGEGGMASVYRVRHNTLGSRHALKLLKVQSEAIRRRLVTEGQVQASLRHPNVVAVTDVLFFGDQPGLVMELVEGPTLHDWLGQYAPTVAEAEVLFKGILAGVSRAHRAGVLHRDLKPGNVLLEPLDGQWIPKVADFGLAKVLADDPAHSQTRSGLPMGTPQYMAPEQIRNAKEVDQRADIWALGCILYELLTGVRPFDGPDIIELYTAIGRGQYRPIEEAVPDVPPHVALAIRGCLSPNADDRIPDCDTLRAVLAGAYTQGGAEEARVASTTALRGTPLVPDRTGPPGKAPPDAPSLEEPPRSAATFAPMSLPPAPGPPPPAAAPVAAAAQGPGPTAPARPRQLALLALLGGGGLAVLGFAIVAFLLLRDGDAPESSTTEPAAATTTPPTPEPAATATEPAPTEATEAPPATPPAAKPSAAKPASLTPRPGATKPTATPAATPAAAPTPARTTGRVVITGEVSQVVLHGQDKDYPPGAVPPGTYTATATFDNRGPASVEPFVVRANETTTLLCEPTFQMCRPR